MRLAYRSVAAFNVATALWLTVMFLVLRRPGFQLDAVMTFSVAAFCAFAFWSTRDAASGMRATAPPWMHAATLAGSLILGACGAWAIYQDLQPNANFEGFVLIIGAAWMAQGALAALTLVNRNTKITV